MKQRKKQGSSPFIERKVNRKIYNKEVQAIRQLRVKLAAWIRTPDWSTSQTYLQAHPELLTEAAAQVLATLTQHQPDQQVHELLMLHQLLLQIAGQQGMEAAYQALLDAEEKNDSATSEQEE